MFAELARVRVVTVRHLVKNCCLLQRPLPNNLVITSLPTSTACNVGNLSCVKMGIWPALLHLESLQRLVPSWFKPQNTANVRFLLSGILLGFSFSLTATSFVLYFREKRQRETVSRFKPRPIELRSNEIVQGITGLIGSPTCSQMASHVS